MKHRHLILTVLLLTFSGCVMLRTMQFNQMYGRPNTARRSALARSKNSDNIDYQTKIRPILEARCAVCHGCYDSPCQLKLTSYEGMERGASKLKVYNSGRLIADNLTRLFIDATNAQQWREKEFSPILNERTPSPESNTEGSVMYKMLELKRRNPLPRTKQLSGFDFSLDRAERCPTIEEFSSFAKDCPLWGMPYGLPAISDEEFQILKAWLEQGAPYSSPPPLSEAHLKRVRAWETFFNGDSLKEQLMSRYIYEHLFLGHLYFDDLPTGEFFELVRSKTPPGEPIDIVATRRVYNHPGVDRVYYRLSRVRSTILVKTHMPYALNEAKMARYRELFLEPKYEVKKLPSYRTKTASNPFDAFRDLPEVSRYKFMLDEAQFTIMGFIKGPVCRGQVALNVINDQFWVVFVTPDAEFYKEDSKFLAEHSDLLRLPSEQKSSTLPSRRWLEYSRLQRSFLEAKTKAIEKILSDGKKINLDLIWDGGGSNPNAALTVFRHFDSASVVQGLVGAPPKTAWLIDFTLLERIHYLLVAGFDVYGNFGHQLLTRLYMDFLRMEGESQFLALLPEEIRIKERNYWYRGAHELAKEFIFDVHTPYGHQLDIKYTSDNPKQELFDKLKTHISAVLNHRYDLSANISDPNIQQQLERLSKLEGHSVSLLPQTAFLTIPGHGVFTIISNSAHTNITSLFEEKKNRLPEEDTLTVARGLIGAYPGMLWQTDKKDLTDLVNRLIMLEGEEQYEEFLDMYGIRRTNSDFWKASDKLHEYSKQSEGIDAGLFDYNRLENR